MGRWASDIYEIYVRANDAQAISFTARAGSVDFEELAAIRSSELEEFDELDERHEEIELA